MKLLQRWFLLATAFATMGNLSAAYADSKMKALLNLTLEELLQIKVVGSTLAEESLHSVPSSVTVVTHAQIRQLGVNTLEELMNHVPGYQSYRSDNAIGSYASRSRLLVNSAREVLLLLDGQRLNHDMFGSAFFDRELSLENVARVEFIRGPGSAIYGANAFLGVINVITATDLNEAALSGGSHQQQQAILNVSGQLENGLQSSLFAQARHSDGEKQTVYNPLTDSFVDSRQDARNQSLYWRAQWGDWGLLARWVETVNEDGYSIGTIGDGFNRYETSASFLSLNYQHTLGSHWEFSSRLYDSPYRYEPEFQTRSVPLTISQTLVEGSESGFENQLRWHEGSAKALLGLDYTRSSVDKMDTNLWLPPAVPNAPFELFGTETRRVTGAYVQWQDALGEQLTYILGVRKDNYSDVNGYISPRLGLIWQVGNDNTLKWLYGEAFRAPARSELSLKNNPNQIGNPNLDPEISKTVELVWMQTGRRHYSSVSLFDTEIEDAVEITNTAPPRTYISGASQQVSGIEMEWQWYFAPGWQLRGDLSHIFNSPLDPNVNAEDLLRSSFLYSKNEFTASLSGRYHGKTRDANTSAAGYRALGGYTLFDVHAHYQVTAQWQVYSNVRNLTDKAYLQPAISRSTNPYGAPGLGREIEVGVRWNFD